MYSSIFGYCGGALLSVNLIPQIYKALRTKSTRDLSWIMLCLNTTGSILYGTYGILVKSPPVYSTIGVTLLQTLVLALLKCVYDRADKPQTDDCLEVV